MLRHFCKKVISLERSGMNIQKCLPARFCSSLGQDETEITDTEQDREKSLQKEFSFCNVTLMGRVGVQPKLVEMDGSHSFVSFMIGVDPARKDNTKWHEVNVNSSTLQKQILKDINVGDRVYVTGRLSYTQDEQYARKYKIYSDYVRLVSHSKKFWDQRLEAENKEADGSD